MLRMWCLILVSGLTLTALAATKPLQTFVVKDYLRHQWTDEVVHFPVAYRGSLPKSLMLTDADGKALPCQLSGMMRKNGMVTGTVWTVVTLPAWLKLALPLTAWPPCGAAGSRLHVNTAARPKASENPKPCRWLLRPWGR